MMELINKQSALSVCKEYGWIDDEDFVEGYNTAIKDISEAIKELPTIEAEPVRLGRWIKQENGLNLCSVCGVTKVSHLPFCGHCGAKMNVTNTNVCDKGGQEQ